MKKHITYSKRAGAWVVTTIDDSGKKKIQKQEWITLEADARKFMGESGDSS